ncbi:MAG: glycogen debranching protein [Candidatus Riflebacteria bacterium]|nr:glycogen debranching protein [Candidatus Riflebacteria bacterium]
MLKKAFEITVPQLQKECEWLLTNGIGGFASSTVSCVNTRRYHGLLVAAQNPPVERLLLVSQLEEELIIDGVSYFLTSDVSEKGVLEPENICWLESFVKEPLPEWHYRIKDVLLIKSLCMQHGSNTTLVTYRIFSNTSSVDLKLTPYFSCRDFHGNTVENIGISQEYSEKDGELIFKPLSNAPEIYMRFDSGFFLPKFAWKSQYLAIEEERGLPAAEDLFSYGSLEIKNYKGFASIAFSDASIVEFNPVNMKKQEELRLHKVANSIPSNDLFLKKLLLAADQFIVARKSTGEKTVLAGYPWFSDWGRDTLIALPGLSLVSGRFDDAASILKTFAANIKYGLVPNCFPDRGDDALYNSVDASLWFFFAVYKYLQYTDDYEFVRRNLYHGMEVILDSMRDGTLYGIKADPEDNLLMAGYPDTQLTWMDVKIDGYVVTPRNGKAVEINALWYNALKIFALLKDKFESAGREFEIYASSVKSSFFEKFWNPKLGTLYDYIAPDGKANTDFRPNQIYAVYLPFSLLSPTQEKSVVDKVFERLYTPRGLRSLDRDDPAYCPFYLGDRRERDMSYHQGTVWSHLAGPFISSYLKVNGYSADALMQASGMIESFRIHMENEACIGGISEIFDAEPPHAPRGACNQAWSVGEVLRVYYEDIKGQRPTLVI